MLTLPDNGRHVTLLLGGARSGKSRIGEALVSKANGSSLYLATAEARDDEMSDRIHHHQIRRGEDWSLIEEPIELARILKTNIGPEHVVLVDCLTLWLSNLLERELDVRTALEDLLAALQATRARVVLISNEVGLGIVPDNPLARHFRDEAGFMHQKIAAIADQVAFVVAGLPLMLKQSALQP